MNRILWHSNAPWSTVGYGVQTGIFVPRIKQLGYDIAISAFYGLGGSKTNWDDIEVFPSDDSWGNRLLAPYAVYHGKGDPKRCLVITLMDVWVLTNHKHLSQLNIASWVPVDHQPCPPKVKDYFRGTGATPIAMSRFGHRMLEAEGLHPVYVPHGVETDVFYPRDDLETIRKRMDVPMDAFVVGMVANNKGWGPARKAFPEALAAFARFHRKHKDSYLYLHTEQKGVRAGINLMKLVDTLDIPENCVRWAPQLQMELGIAPEVMAYLYSGMDVLLNPSYGEGFGIPIIEAQACGTPVIVTDWTSMPELCGAGWLVGGEPYFDAPHDSFFLRPSIAKIVTALNKAYDRASSMREQAVKFAAAYDADRVTTEFWKPVLEKLMADRDIPDARPVAVEAI